MEESVFAKKELLHVLSDQHMNSSSFVIINQERRQYLYNVDVSMFLTV